jgi:hypothetical protein
MNIIRLTINKDSHHLAIKLTSTHERLVKIYANFTLTAKPLPGKRLATIVTMPLDDDDA